MLQKNNDMRTKIIQNTRELMRQQSKITIKEIAEKSYVNIAAVNYYFGGKEQLINIVFQEVVDELKQTISNAIGELPADAPMESTLHKMIDMIYRFALENHGIINYMFLYSETQKNSANLIVREFLSDNDFTKKILPLLSQSTGVIDEATLYSRYVLLFSSFCIPLFISLIQEYSKEQHDQPMMLLNDEAFRQRYIQDLIRVIR